MYLPVYRSMSRKAHPQAHTAGHILPSLLFIVLYSSIFAQVPDSTFGVPESFMSPLEPYPAVTGCDFDGREDRCFASLFLPDGKIILAGYTQGDDGVDFALVRLLHDGKFDTLAGPKGQMRIDLGYPNDSCLAAAMYGPDKIVMAGCVTLPGQSGYSLLVARVNTAGQIDTDFGLGGHLAIDLPMQNEMITRIIVLPDGKTLIAGNAFFGDSYAFPDSTSVFVGRLLPDGQVDSTFGTDGFLYHHYENTCKSSLLGDMILDSQGRITFSGASYSPYPYSGNIGIDDWCTHNIHICRYTPDGIPDAGFGENGVLELPFTEGRAIAFHVDEQDRLLLAGVVTDLLLTYPVYTFLARFLPDGTPDSSFANNGRFVKHLYCVSGSSEPMEIIKTANNYLIGTLDIVDGWHGWFGVVSLTEEGMPDNTFGKGGIYNSSLWLPATSYDINQIHTLDSQSIYFSGYYRLLTHDNMMIAKIKRSGTVFTGKLDGRRSPELLLFPNPAVSGGRIFFELGEGQPVSELVQVQIADVQGRVIFNQERAISEGANEMDLPNISPGYYWISFTGRDLRYVSKLLVY